MYRVSNEDYRYLVALYGRILALCTAGLPTATPKEFNHWRIAQKRLLRLKAKRPIETRQP